jgi:hypothetical protein
MGQDGVLGYLVIVDPVIQFTTRYYDSPSGGTIVCWYRIIMDAIVALTDVAGTVSAYAREPRLLPETLQGRLEDFMLVNGLT